MYFHQQLLYIPDMMNKDTNKSTNDDALQFRFDFMKDFFFLCNIICYL